MERKDLYLEYRRLTIEKGINPIGKKRFNGIVDVLEDIKQLQLDVVSNNEAIEMKKLQKQHIINMMQEDEKIGLYSEVAVCDNCKDVTGFYLGTTCQKCNRPFRDIKQTEL
jgi:hypothetical protein